jgi:hypothetical protein
MAALERPTRIPIESRPTGTPKTTRTARFTPQQAEDSLATHKSTRFTAVTVPKVLLWSPFGKTQHPRKPKDPAHPHLKNTRRAARFTPQQAEDSLATRKSTTSILRLSRKYPLIPF